MKKRVGVLLIVCFSLPALAQAIDRTAIIADRAAMQAAVDQRAMVLQAAGRGATLISNNEQYQMLPGARAALPLPQETQQQTVARVGGNQFIEGKGNFVVYTAPQGVVGIAQVNGATTYPTVINARTGGIGILPGTVNVLLKDMSNADAIASDYGLEVVYQFAHLKTVFYRVKPGQDVVAAAAKLAADARVASAQVEVLEHMNEPH